VQFAVAPAAAAPGGSCYAVAAAECCRCRRRASTSSRRRWWQGTWRNGAGEVGSDRAAASRRTQSFWRVLPVQPRFDDRESRNILPLSGLILSPRPGGKMADEQLHEPE
jgi:hypothetical protein